MIDDEKEPTDTQRQQAAAGQYLALSNAVHALMRTHPDLAALASALDDYASVTDQILLTRPALQVDDGMRQTYSETMRSLRDAIHPR